MNKWSEFVADLDRIAAAPLAKKSTAAVSGATGPSPEKVKRFIALKRGDSEAETSNFPLANGDVKMNEATVEERLAALEAFQKDLREEHKLIVQDLYSWFDARIATLNEDIAAVEAAKVAVDQAVYEGRIELEDAVKEFAESLGEETILKGIKDAVQGLVIPVRPATRAEVQAGTAVATRQASASEIRK